MRFNRAITRKPSRNFASGITDAKWDSAPDFKKICRQHDAYIQTLEDLGLAVTVLEADPELPDAYFVEDPAVMFAGSAMVTRPGASSRLPEAERLAPVLAQYREIHVMQPPGHLDGGDVMQVEGHIYIGLSNRSNEQGAHQLGRVVQRQGLTWSTIPVLDGLHLKTGVNYLGGNTFLMREAYALRPEFAAANRIIVEEDEKRAANTLLVNDTLLTPQGFPKTRRKLEALGRPVVALEMSEVIKMDGGLSCLSLRF